MTWGEYLNVNKEIPTNAFHAFYFDAAHPKEVVASEKVKEISVNYPYKEFHGIDSSRFGGYWVGDFVYEKEKKEVFYVSQSQSKLRLIVDGYVLYEGSNSEEIPYLFTKGKHRIEVEHLNHWHTTRMNVKIGEYFKKYTLEELKDQFSYLKQKDFTIWYTGIYESRNIDSSVEITLKESEKPVVLIFQSYRATNWKINNPHHTKIEVVILNSYSPIAMVEGIDKKTPLYYTKRSLGYGYQLTRKCSCTSGHFHCSGSVFKDRSISALFNKKIDGFSGVYGTKGLTIPQKRMEESVYNMIEKNEKEIKEKRKVCSKNRDIDFKKLFD